MHGLASRGDRVRVSPLTSLTQPIDLTAYAHSARREVAISEQPRDSDERVSRFGYRAQVMPQTREAVLDRNRIVAVAERWVVAAVHAALN